MKNGRNQRDVLSIERTLGLRSERGISRQSNKESPPIEAVLKGIKNIQVAYVSKDLEEIRSSQTLRDDANVLFEEYGHLIWPGPDEGRPAWLEEPSDERYDGRYPQGRHYTDPEDREFLRDYFVELVIEKCTNFHENQLQKHRRLTAKQLSQQLQQDYETTAESAERFGIEDNPDQDSGIVADAAPFPHPGVSDKARSFQEQFAAYTSPVPFIPHGLPLSEGQYARPSSSRRSPTAQYSTTSRKRLPGTEPERPTKRSRIIREDGTRQESLIVKMKVNPHELTHLAQTGRTWTPVYHHRHASEMEGFAPSSNQGTPLRHDEGDTIRVNVHRAQATLTSDSNHYVSPYGQKLPFGGKDVRNGSPLEIVKLNRTNLPPSIGNTPGRPLMGFSEPDAGRLVNPIHAFPNAPTHIDLTAGDESLNAPRSSGFTPVNAHQLVHDILGDLAQCPVARELLDTYPTMSRDRLENLKAVLTEFPETRSDLFLLEKRIRALAAGPRSNSSLSKHPTSAATPAPTHVGIKPPPAVERTSRMAHEVLGDLIRCPAAAAVLTTYPLISKEQAEAVRSALLAYPETQRDFSALQKLIKFEAWDVVTGATTFPDDPPNYSTAPPKDSSAEPKREPSTDIKKEPDTSRRLDNILVEISWGRDTEYSDHMELQDLDTVKELFTLIELYLPDELQSDDHRIKEVRIKTKTDLQGGNTLPRIVRDESRGRAAVRHLLKRLRSQPAELEIELVFSIIWERVGDAA